MHSHTGALPLTHTFLTVYDALTLKRKGIQSVNFVLQALYDCFKVNITLVRKIYTSLDFGSTSKELENTFRCTTKPSIDFEVYLEFTF